LIGLAKLCHELVENINLSHQVDQGMNAECSLIQGMFADSATTSAFCFCSKKDFPNKIYDFFLLNGSHKA
jgi:hypothetical protein